MAPFDEFHARFRKQIRELRIERGFRQQDLDERGISLRTVQQMEEGRRLPRLDTLFALAASLNVEVADLFHFRGDNQDNPAATGRGGRRVRGKPAGAPSTPVPARARERRPRR